jgi:sRNA-binding regulator protein Hfq
VKPAERSATQHPAAQKDRPECDIRFFSQARAENKPVTVTLQNGRTYTGRAARIGRYNLEIETSDGPVVIFKTAIATLQYAS